MPVHDSSTRIRTVSDLDEALSRPTTGVLETLRRVPGDIIVLGAGGKMGPTLAVMVRRGFDMIGMPERRVFAVSRFSSSTVRESLQRSGVTTISAVCLMPMDASICTCARASAGVCRRLTAPDGMMRGPLISIRFTLSASAALPAGRPCEAAPSACAASSTMRMPRGAASARSAS